ncbi:MAG: isoprenylcysteine carboxylmethyltransferase family protein [candidate division Zixibacteria bacterium]|nr:isoprenylcysteine carboxylmethyltransferase family protein [candidate division Zixibacteria bacterium]
MKEKNGEHPFGDAGQLIWLGLFLVVWAGDSFFLRLSTFLSAYLLLYIRLAILCIMFITAIYLFRSGHIVVNREQKPDKVITSGAFKYVRHPLYLASNLTYLGLAISTLSLLSLGLFAGIFIFYNFLASYEEKLLEEKFGEEYRKYKEKTGKWMPRIGRNKSGAVSS